MYYFDLIRLFPCSHSADFFQLGIFTQEKVDFFHLLMHKVKCNR